MRKCAVIDHTGKYRYTLTREWDKSIKKVVFIMLNPSTADAYNDDQTIKRCINFAMKWGYGSLEVVNLFAYRATDWTELKEVMDPIGSENDRYIMDAVKSAEKVVLAWGNNCSFSKRHRKVLKMLLSYRTNCLKMNKSGHPAHPLYVKSDIQPRTFTQTYQEDRI